MANFHKAWEPLKFIVHKIWHVLSGAGPDAIILCSCTRQRFVDSISLLSHLLRSILEQSWCWPWPSLCSVVRWIWPVLLRPKSWFGHTFPLSCERKSWIWLHLSSTRFCKSLSCNRFRAIWFIQRPKKKWRKKECSNLKRLVGSICLMNSLGILKKSWAVIGRLPSSSGQALNLIFPILRLPTRLAILKPESSSQGMIHPWSLQWP